jgi:hopene-associated glycosyltransferase HpnB
MEYLVAAGALLWVAILLVPWRPWDTRERLEAIEAGVAPILSDITVLIPARNEAASIRRTLSALKKQGGALKIVLVNDQSSDETVPIARSTLETGLSVIDGTSLPDEWTGKLWALEQGLRTIGTDLLLLLDADIELEPGMVGALKQKLLGEKLDLVSIMAWLRMETFWEKLLAPAFIYFFKLIYPFSFGNSPDSTLGVAAGGCILVRAEALRKAGAFSSIRNAIIDDCALASQIKASGGHTWVGLSRSVRSHRPYPRFATFCEMVARTAYTQLRYSIGLLLATSLLMALVFLFPFLGLSLPSLAAKCFALTGVCAMLASYLPTLRYYQRSGFWALTLPLVGCLYLVMTWASAVRFWQGKPSEWKGRNLHRSQVFKDL